MAKIDLDGMNIDELASLRDRAIEKLAEKVAARQAEIQRLSQFGGKVPKKAQAAPATASAKKRERTGEAELQAKPEAEQASEAV